MNPTTQPVRIGNAQAFWGDRTDAAAEMLAREPDLDYLTLDYLAEVSMSILATQRERDPTAGFADEFVDVVRSLVPYWSSGGRCRLITNAGGLNPRGCAETCRKALAEAGCRPLRIGVVSGDDVLEQVRHSILPLPPGEPAVSVVEPGRGEGALYPAEFRNLDTNEPINEVRDRLVTANAYLGSAPIVNALADGADIVITGRVADPSLTVAPCICHFGWNENELDRLAGATVAGHLIECGTQVTGGISSDWLSVPDAANIGFPIVEVSQDGSCIVTKPRGTGGCVTALTVKEQLLYEIGDPANYLSPDVAVSFLSLTVADLGNNRVRVSGATGKPRPEKYKVSATYRDGFRSAGTLTIVGRDAVAKARRVGEFVLQRICDAGYELRESVIECLGSGDAVGQVIAPPSNDLMETVLRVAVEADAREAIECFTRELMPFITSGPQGTTGYAEGRPRIHPIFRYWPCLIARDAVHPQVELLASPGTRDVASSAARGADILSASEAPIQSANSTMADKMSAPRCLYDIACARSGDKGTSANIGVIARNADWWDFLRTWLTADRVAEYFAPLGVESVDRFELPNLGALNFLLHGVLRQSLRTDAQGKALGQVLLELQLPADRMPKRE